MNRRFLIALLIALVLPFAQLAAAAHEVTHLHAGSQKSTPVSIHCDVCALAAAVTGGAAAAEPPVLVHASANPPAPVCNELPAPESRRIALFLSRAPPSLR